MQPLKNIQYHWANRTDPRSRLRGYVGKALVEIGVMLIVTAVVIVLASILMSTRPEYFDVSYFGQNITYGAITTGTFALQARRMFCTIIADEEPENYR